LAHAVGGGLGRSEMEALGGEFGVGGVWVGAAEEEAGIGVGGLTGGVGFVGTVGRFVGGVEHELEVIAFEPDPVGGFLNGFKVKEMAVEVEG